MLLWVSTFWGSLCPASVMAVAVVGVMIGASSDAPVVVKTSSEVFALCCGTTVSVSAVFGLLPVLLLMLMLSSMLLVLVAAAVEFSAATVVVVAIAMAIVSVVFVLLCVVSVGAVSMLLVLSSVTVVVQAVTGSLVAVPLVSVWDMLEFSSSSFDVAVFVFVLVGMFSVALQLETEIL